MVAREFPEVVLVRNAANVGFARANNQAAGTARGRYLFFLNNDTVVPAETLRRLVEFADAHPDVGMIGPRLRDPHGRLQISYRRRPTVAALLHRTRLLRWTGLFRRAYRRYRRPRLRPGSERRVEVLMGAAVLLPRDGVLRLRRLGRGVHLRRRGHRPVPARRPSHGRSSTCRTSRSCTTAGSVRGRTWLRRAERDDRLRALPAQDRHAAPAALRLYKLVVTLDAPVQLADQVRAVRVAAAARPARQGGEELAGRRGLWHFLQHGLRAFWRAN